MVKTNYPALDGHPVVLGVESLAHGEHIWLGDEITGHFQELLG